MPLKAKVLYAAGLLILVLMTWDLFFSDHGYFVFRQEKQEELKLETEIEVLKQRKEKLAKEVIRLRKDPKALEDVIHKELGYVYPDETMIIMPKPASKMQEDKKK